MPDREKVFDALRNCITEPKCKDCPWETCEKFHQTKTIPLDLCLDILELLQEQEEQKRKWLQTIADTQLAISPTGYESEDELAKRGWEWNGLQIAWEIIAGEERSEHPRLVRCKECVKHGSVSCPMCKKYVFLTADNWFCADGELEEGR